MNVYNVHDFMFSMIIYAYIVYGINFLSEF